MVHRREGSLDETVESAIDWGDGPINGLEFRVARSLHEVLAAWHLVYSSYRRIGLIDPNPWAIHTVPQAVRPGVSVVVGWFGELAASTVTIMPDGPGGLPLDSVYPDHLARFRAAGRRLVEVGLFADRRGQLSRSITSLTSLLCFAVAEALRLNGDLVIGVHPRHARFYQRAAGFERFAADSVHPTVKNHPVVPLHLDAQAKMGASPRPWGLDHVVTRLPAAAAFEGRYGFSSQDLDLSSPLLHYLAAKVESSANPEKLGVLEGPQ